MGLEAKAGFVGLVTATGEATAGQGALRVADNVTLRKEGALTLRSTFGSTALSRQYAAAFPYRGQLWFLSAANVLYNPAQTAITINLGGSTTLPAAIRTDIQSAKEARGSLYLATSEGVLKIATAADTTFRPSGLAVGAASIVLAVQHSSGALLTTGQQVAYRVVGKYTDPNGVVLRSRPTGAVFVSATSATGAGRVDVAFASLYGIVPDEIEIYRTRIFPAGVTLDDEFQLVGTVLRSSINYPTTSTFTFVDQVSDVARGTTLYTSPSRGGIENANDRPPGAACIERFRASLFFGNIRGPQRIRFSWDWPSAGTDRTGQTTGLGYRSATGNVTNGSNQITSVSNLTGVQTGMTCQYGGTYMGRVESIVGSTVTAQFTASATVAGASILFIDSFTVATPGFSDAVVQTKVGLTAYNTSYFMNRSYGWLNAYEVTPATPGNTETLVIERFARGGSAFTVRASHGDEYDPPLPLHSATGTSSTYDDIPNGLMWSEPDEPEHVPPKNFARVGDAGKAILALVATKDRLLIFKEDGLFMLTGDTAKNFAIYPLDTTCLCILPGSVKRLQNTVYALTNLGLVAVDEGGSVTVVSRPVQNELAPIVTQIRQTQQSTGTYLMPGLTGVTGTSDDPNGEYWLMLGTTTPSFGGQMLVYNAFKQGFTTYSFGTPTPVAVSQDGSGQPLVLTASSLLTPSTSQGAITARISPRAFTDPALVGKVWTHIVAGFSLLTGTASVTAKFSSSESMVAGTEVSEALEAPTSAGLIQLPGGSLLRHPMPRAMARAFLTFVEVVVAVTSGSFVLEVLGAETREDIPNKRPTHGTGAS